LIAKIRSQLLMSLSNQTPKNNPRAQPLEARARTTNTQRRNVFSHPKLAMKKLSFAAFILFAFLILSSATGVSAAAERAAGKFADKLVFYVHVAQLYTKDPDKKLAMPVQNVEKKQIANTWHAPRDGSRLHEGQDIFAPRGTPVLSASKGYVVNIGENSLGGQTVSVIGAGGRVYYYAHLEAYAPNLAEGDYVTTQTLLGYVGTTGNAAGTPPHLHFGVYEPRGATNPLPLLNDRPAEKKPAPDTQPARARKSR
jgi:murein DD-endopeptidase MepM/ murein hydrolase activator NlpD